MMRSPVVPILAGAGGAVVAVLGADKLGVNPNAAAWGTAIAGAATALGTDGMARQLATGVGAAGMCLGTLQLISQAKMQAMKKEAATAQASAAPRRQAEGDNFVTRQELNDALARVAESQQKGHGDLLSALDDIKKIVAASPEVTGKPLAAPPRSTRSPLPDAAMPKLYPLYTRDAEADDYERNAYAEEDPRDADVDDERNADVDDYERNAYGAEDARNADVDDWRNANGGEWLDGVGDVWSGGVAANDNARNADGEDEELRNADEDGERNGDGDEWRDADVDDAA